MPLSEYLVDIYSKSWISLEFMCILTKNGISLQEHDFSKFVYFSDNLKNGVKQFVPLKFAQILKANIWNLEINLTCIS